MTQHPHADILRAIADGEQIQYQYIESEWRDRDSCFVLARLSNLDVTRPFYKFRIKPATITLNGTELPKPVSPEPEDTWKCYGLRIGDDIFWFNTPEDRDAVYAKLVEVLS